MDRREFFRTLVGGVSVIAAVRTWPFRVFSFPSKIVIPSHRFSFFEMFALNGPEMSEFLPSDFDMDLDTFIRSQRPWLWEKPIRRENVSLASQRPSAAAFTLASPL